MSKITQIIKENDCIIRLIGRSTEIFSVVFMILAAMDSPARPMVGDELTLFLIGFLMAAISMLCAALEKAV